MVWQEAKARMQILALGNKVKVNIQQDTQKGFTLMELMVVVAIIAIASAGVMFAIPDASATALERDAQRLAALLDSARAQSRASGLAVTWHATPQGFNFDGLPQAKNANTGEMVDLVTFPTSWLNADTSVAESSPANSVLLLGPEPIIAQQEVVLLNGGRSLTLATDGIRPFSIKFSDTTK
jgi:general secretion pathway protein H